MKKILIATIVILSFFASSLLVSAEPTYDITLNPSSPVKESTIKFTADVSNGTISEVRLIVKECKDDFCYTDGFNVSMTKNASSGQYEKEIKLTHGEANNIEYWLVIKSNGVWYDFQESYLQKDLKASGGTNGNSNSNSKKTPGFELIVFILSIAVLLFVIRQKRVK